MIDYRNQMNSGSRSVHISKLPNSQASVLIRVSNHYSATTGKALTASCVNRNTCSFQIVLTKSNLIVRYFKVPC